MLSAPDDLASRPRLDPRTHRRRRVRHSHRRVGDDGDDRGDGPRVAPAVAAADRLRSVERCIRPSAARESSISVSDSFAPRGSPTWASWGGSCLVPYDIAAHIYDTIMRRGRPADRLPRAQLAASGEGLPQLGSRHLRRRLTARGRPRLHDRLGQARRIRREGGAGRRA